MLWKRECIQNIHHTILMHSVILWRAYFTSVRRGTGRGGEDVGNVRPEAEEPKVYSTPIQIMICYITLFVA